MKIAVLQSATVSADIAANLERLSVAVTDARTRGAEFLIAPEMFLTGYWIGDQVFDLAEPETSTSAVALSALAQESGVTLLAGMPIREDDRVFNTAILAHSDGSRALYRKRQLYGAEEKRLFSPGDARPLIAVVGGLKVGILICYDLEFPELARQAALAGADLLAVPTALPASGSGETVARLIVPARAFENQVFVAYANLCGEESGNRYCGLSCIVAPDGQDLARADGMRDGLLIAEIDPTAYAATRAENPYLDDLNTL